jgi:hypothetical protein
MEILKSALFIGCKKIEGDDGQPEMHSTWGGMPIAPAKSSLESESYLN